MQAEVKIIPCFDCHRMVDIAARFGWMNPFARYVKHHIEACEACRAYIENTVKLGKAMDKLRLQCLEKLSREILRSF